MTERIQAGGLQVAKVLHDLVANEIAPGTGVDANHFWTELEAIITELAPVNKALLARRDDLQAQIDAWHQQRRGQSHNAAEYRAFLDQIGYLLPEAEEFTITTENVDSEIAKLAGPQLVVPVMNARYALNAANARWGSLYDALYGTDVIPEQAGAEKGRGYNPERGALVIAYARRFLDEAAPLAKGSHADSCGYGIKEGQLAVKLKDGTETALQQPEQFVGYQGDLNNPSAILIKNNGIHLEIQINPEHVIGKDDPANVKDVLLESALTTIMDCEDSIAAVDAEDKAVVYGNWLGLMKGTLGIEFKKGDSTVTRTLNPDREYVTPDGNALSLPGRSLMFVRNVGHLMTNEAVLDKDGNEIPEGILDGNGNVTDCHPRP